MMKKINYIIGMIVIGIFLSCENEAIPYYNSENDAVRFSNKNNDGYGGNGIVYQSYSFVSNPLDEYVIYDIPVILIGNTSDKDRTVNYTIDTEKSTATEGSYELMEGIIPANHNEGYIRIKLYNVTGDKTYELRISIQSSDELEKGPSLYLNAALSWSNSIPTPPNTYTRITYNMLIQSPLSFSSSSISYYSPNALKTIIAAFNWNDWDNPDAHPEYPAAYKRYFTQANYKYLPHYILLNVEQSYSSFATQLGKYIEEYNSTHDTPLLHDAGTLLGQPIEARKY